MFKLLLFPRETNVPPYYCPDFLAEDLQQLLKLTTGHSPAKIADSGYMLMDNTLIEVSTHAEHLIDIAIPHNDRMYVFSFYPHMYEDILKRLANAQANLKLGIEAVVFPFSVLIIPQGTSQVLSNYIQANLDLVQKAALSTNMALKEEIRAGTLVIPNMRNTPEG